MNSRRWRMMAVAILCSLLATAARAATSADVSAEADASALVAGKPAVVAVVMTVNTGLHAQSHTPGNPDYLPLIVTAKADAAGVAVGDVRYPPGEDVDYPALGHLNVYVGRTVMYVPLTVAADAKPGPVKITGTVEIQACNDKSCFPPERLPFTVETTVVAAGTAVTATDPTLFADMPKGVPTTAPATQPAKAAVVPPADGGNWLGGLLKTGGLPVGIVAALVIGVLFNAVPCVLPVLPLKVLGFYEVSKHNRGRCLLLGGVFGAGIVAVFLILGVLIAGLHVIDWGRLYQQTWFVAALTVLLLAVAAGTFGLFDLALPSGVYGFNPRHDNVSGNFLFGMFTAVLSTPCTFGLLTTLLIYATTLSTPVAVGLFALMGVGMAAPYVILSAFPEVARKIPRTGAWSAVIKQVMGLAMVAAAVFVGQSLLARVMPLTATWWVLFGTIAVTAVYLLVRAAQLSGFRWPTLVAGGVSAAVVGVALWFTVRVTTSPFMWQEYSPAALAEATAAGHPVVIDFTANWCSTCHVIEATSLQAPALVTAVRDHQAVMLRADVTHGTEAGQSLLNRLNPTKSIPFTAVYAPHADANARPATLDGIYSGGDLVGTLNRVAGG